MPGSGAKPDLLPALQEVKGHGFRARSLDPEVPSTSRCPETEIDLLLSHYSTLFSDYLGGDAAKARQEWRRLKLFVGRSEALTALSYTEL